MIEKIKRSIEDGTRFLIASHIDPDGDALGSMFSLYWVLKSLGKTTYVYMKDGVPYRYDFLPGPQDLIHTAPSEHFDAVFVLDCGSLFRVGDDYEKIGTLGPLISIDHHETNEAFGMINLLDKAASSTAEVLYSLFVSMNVEFSQNVAVNMYTGVFTDTGSLRYENTNPKAFDICRRMVEVGVKPAYVARMVYENHPKERFLLLGEALRTLRTISGERVALAYVTEEMFQRTGTTGEYADGFSEEFRKLSNIEASVFIRQIAERKFKISMRSKGVIDVAAICGHFGGGGHKNAAGCSIEGDLAQVQEKIETILNTSID